MGVIHICGNQHKITRATIVIYSERKSRHVLIIWSCPILSGPRPLCAPQTINTYIPDNKTYGFHQLWEHRMFITSPPEGVARYCFHPVCLCVCVCVSVCPANILVFYFSAIRRDIDLKFIQDTYRVVLNSLK